MYGYTTIIRIAVLDEENGEGKTHHLNLFHYDINRKSKQYLI